MDVSFHFCGPKASIDFTEVLPVELSILIFSLCKKETIATCSLVCHTWKKLCDDNQVWQAIANTLQVDLNSLKMASSFKIHVKKFYLSMQPMMSLESPLLKLKRTKADMDQ